MTRQMIKLIAATFAVVVTLSLATIIAGAEKGKQIVECANSTMALNTYIAAPGDEILSTVSVSNCSKDQPTVAVEQILTDSCGDSWSMGTTTLRLRRGETRQMMMSFLAPGCDGATVTVRVTGQSGVVLDTTSAYLTMTNPTP